MRFVIVQDYKENRRKCTLTPLEGREEIAFIRLRRPVAPPRREPRVPLTGGLLLHVEGPPLCFEDRGCSVARPLVLVDCTWARVRKVLSRLDPPSGISLERRSLPPSVVSAYPRTSKLYEDPKVGLASVEALYAATVILGQPRADFLHGYRWAEEFLRSNRRVFQQFGRDAASTKEL